MAQPATIRPATAADADACAAIYEHYVLRTTCTFEDAPPPVAEFGARINNAKLFLCAESDGEICGYTYADLWRTRCGYRFVVETSVYVDADKTRRGTGALLMTALLSQFPQPKRARQLQRYHCRASVALHEKLGFAACGKLPAIGWKFDGEHDFIILPDNRPCRPAFAKRQTGCICDKTVYGAGGFWCGIFLLSLADDWQVRPNHKRFRSEMQPVCRFANAGRQGRYHRR